MHLGTDMFERSSSSNQQSLKRAFYLIMTWLTDSGCQLALSNSKF